MIRLSTSKGVLARRTENVETAARHFRTAGSTFSVGPGARSVLPGLCAAFCGKARGFSNLPMRTDGVAGKSGFGGSSKTEGGFGFLLPALGQIVLWLNGFVHFGLLPALGQMWEMTRVLSLAVCNHVQTKVIEPFPAAQHLPHGQKCISKLTEFVKLSLIHI